MSICYPAHPLSVSAYGILYGIAARGFYSGLFRFFFQRNNQLLSSTVHLSSALLGAKGDSVQYE